ncbi:hypothetical protein ARSEF1564_002492 [Beauveria bassiana]
MSADMERRSANHGGDGPECAETCANTAAGATGKSSKVSERSAESALVDTEATDFSESSAASSALLAHFTLPAPSLAPFSALSPPVSPDSGPRSAPAGPSTGYNSTSTDTQILHSQRLELQDRLKRLSHQDPLYFDPALLPSPSARPKNSSPGTCATSPTLHSIFENFSTEPFRKLRPPERYPGEHGDPYTDPRVHPLHAPIGTASSSSTAATSPPPAPSTSTRSRICQSSAAAASFSFSDHSSRPPAATRRSSGSGPAIRQVKTPPQAHFVLDPPPEFGIPSPPTMVNARKIWVRRPGASPTLITISEDDLVDDVRDIVLRKYANSLGKTFDAPDLHLCVHPRDQKDRLLQPDEHMCRTLDNFFPGGQTVDDAILIDIPRRTPKASPHPVQLGHGQQQHHVPHTAAAIYYTEDGRPLESGEGYFPPVGALPSPHMQLAMPATAVHGGQPHSIAVIGSGHLPTIPSPGGLRPRGHREQTGRPRVARTHTSTSAMNGSHGNYSHGTHQLHPRLAHSRTHSSSSDPVGMPPGTVSVPMPSPGHEHVYSSSGRVGIPSPRMLETRSASNRPKRRPKNVDFAGSAVVAAVPPISILIVEDNPINLKLLEAFVKRLKVRWQTATNGREAVKKWRTGGFHLVLMDIQLPVMNGLEATREIRRLERVNSIGVFSSVPTTPQEELALELNDKDRLENRHHFKGPVIIVALTASSLQSDRHEALAAGCNDFLTKPVNFVWLERKVTEWGCMQALIDFDGWRAWKSFALAEEEANKKAAAAKSKAKKSRSSLAAQI